eukprot:1918288-Pleurochrysis_carterae.AAC.1
MYISSSFHSGEAACPISVKGVYVWCTHGTGREPVHRQEIHVLNGDVIELCRVVIEKGVPLGLFGVGKTLR